MSSFNATIERLRNQTMETIAGEKALCSHHLQFLRGIMRTQLKKNSKPRLIKSKEGK